MYNCSVECIRELEHVLSYEKECNTRASHRLIVGDFNFGEIDGIQRHPVTTKNHLSTKFLEANVVRDNFLYQHVKDATRMRDNQRNLLLNLILTNEENIIKSISIYHH